MPDPSVDAWEDALIADIRAHDGRPTSGPLAGHPLMVLHHIGARTGQPRRAILTYSQEGEDFLVAGTASGAPKDPAWVGNLAAHPAVTIEIGDRSMPVTATILEGADRDRLWDAHVAQLPWFGKYPEQAGRVIPMIRLTPTSAA